MLEQEADDVIERVRDYLKRHGVLIGYDPELPSADFGCDLDHHVAQVRDDPNNHVLSIAIHDEGLWAQPGRRRCTAVLSVIVEEALRHSYCDRTENRCVLYHSIQALDVTRGSLPARLPDLQTDSYTVQ